MALTDKLSAIGQAIRDMTGKAEMLTLDAMPGEIRSIEGGGGSSADVRYVTFMSYDGTEEYIRLPVAVGYDCPEPKIETPTKESTAQYNYTFAGWATTVNGALDSNALKTVTEDRTVYANYISTVRVYTITYYDSDGTTVLKTESLAYGATPSYIPEKEGYGFDGWEPEITTVVGNANYTAIWTESLTFANASWPDIAEISEAGEATNYFKVGDTRDIVCNGNSYTIQIVGFDVDTLADGSGTAGISCLITGTYGTKRAYHSSNTKITWAGCSLRTYCNDTIYNGLDVGLKNIIKQVTKKSYNASSYGSITTNDYCWVPATAEMGKLVFGGIASTYPAITSGAAQRAIGKEYWCRDDNDSANYAYYIDTSGNAKNGSMTGARAIRFGFCI